MADAPKRVAIIGVGIVGACSALMLQRRGHQVVLIDPNPPGNGSSYGNAGCLNGSSVVPMSMPGTLASVPRYLFDPMGPLSIRWRYLPAVAPWLWQFVRAGTPERVAAQAKALRGLLSPTVELMTSLATEAGAAHLVRHEGHLYAYRSESAFAADRAAWDLRRANGVTIELLDAAALRDFDRNLSHELVRGVFVDENGHTTHPHRLVTLLVQRALGNGAELIAASAAGFSTDGSRLKAVATSQGEIPADAAVIAAGAFSKPLAAALGNRVPLDTERGYHLVIEDPEARPRVPTTDGAGKFVASPMDEGLRLAGTVEFGGLEAAPDWRRARVLLGHARRLLPGLSASYPEEQIKLWMGFRPSLPDSLPVIGRSQRSPDVVYAFGHGHVGMTAAPMTAKVVAELLCGEPASIDIAPFAATRFAAARRAA